MLTHFCQFSAHFLLHLNQETYLYAYAQFAVQYSFLVKKSPASLLPLGGGTQRRAAGEDFSVCYPLSGICFGVCPAAADPA